MYGVVLWSDAGQNRAVIWCEDHGDLAFFRGDLPEDPEIDGIEPGDLVRFDLVEGDRLRLARNPMLVAPETYPTLARNLKTASANAAARDGGGACGGHDSKIVPFAAPAPAARPQHGATPRARRG